MKTPLAFALSLTLSIAASAAPFSTLNSALLDPSGTPFVVRGMNRTHSDSWGTPADAARMGANTVRIAFNFTKPAAANLAIAQGYADAGIVPMPGNWSGTCKSDPATLAAIVDTWVAQAPTWTALNQSGLINIANEWGPVSSVSGTALTHYVPIPVYGWRDGYVVAMPRMRTAGYTGTIVIDAPSCGQDAGAVVRDGPAIVAADPLHNVLFDVHVYGMFHYPSTASWQQDYTKAFAAMKASGLPIMLGEIGPGLGIGPSPTTVSPTKIVRDAEANGWGWLAWAVDDVNLAGCLADDKWFSMTYKCGTYTGLAADLTTFGQQIVPLLQVLAQPAAL